MALNDEFYYEIIEFLVRNTDYTYEYLTSIKDDYQLKNMYYRVRECLERYPKEIYNHLQVNPNFIYDYSLEELKQMNYNRLYELRNALKIRGKKTTSQPFINDSPKETREEQIIHQQQNNPKIITEEEREPQILTPEEIAFMYKNEDYSKKELLEKGIISDEIKDPEDKEDIRYVMIDTILVSELTINGTEVTPEDLILLDEQSLTSLYEFVNTFKKKQEDRKRFNK